MVPALLYSKKLMFSRRKNNEIKSRINCERLGLDWMKCTNFDFLELGGFQCVLGPFGQHILRATPLQSLKSHHR